MRTSVRFIRTIHGMLSLILLLASASHAQQTSLRVAGRFFHYFEKDRPKVALVLSGGGSRGISQIGVLQGLEEAHIPVDMIIGTSMGSIIGGLYASGYTASQLDSIAETQDWNQLLALSDAVNRSELFLQQKESEAQSFFVIRLNGLTPILPSAIAGGQRLTTILTQLVLNAPYRVVRSFDDLKIPFRAVATDMVSGKRVVISRGDLAQAMRASSTVPVAFSPIISDTLQLVDGGLISNVPVDVARDLGADIVIAVNTTSPLRNEASIETPWDALDQATSIMMQLSNKLQLEKADIVVTPRLEGHLASDFTNLDSIILDGKIAVGREVQKIDSAAYRAHRPAEVSSGRIANDSTPASQTDDVTISKIPYYENSLLLVAGIKFSGNRKLSDSLLAGPFSELLDHYVTPKQIDQSCEKLIWLYRNADFGMARLDNVIYDSTSATLDLNIDEGNISNVSLRGNEVAKSFLIKREFPLDSADIFTTTKAVEGIKNIYSTGLFSQVLLSTHFDPAPDLTIDVSEKSSRLLSLGFRVDNERNGQLYTSVSDEDLFGSGTEAILSFSGGVRNRLVEADVGTTRILNTDLTYNLRAFTGFADVFTYAEKNDSGAANEWNIFSNGDYRIIRYGFKFSIGTLLARFGMVSASLEYGWDKLKPLQNYSGSYSSRVVALKIGSNVDTRDNAGFPTNGILSNVYFETSLPSLNTEMPFTKILFDYATYHSLFHEVTFGQHYEFGFGNVLLPISRQFSLGGQNLFYGLREDVLVGRQVFLASWELRIKSPVKLFFGTFLSARFDIGDVWATQQNIILKTLKQGIGGSLGFDTPIGPVEFSAGKAFNPGKSTNLRTISTPWTFYFRVGVKIPKVTSY
ncbi:MAG TPA: patatin-like phospholipase family protein [Candidatus Acidoferrales bacterium]|nr:patatin-like phospholipase family protein [Candidatus Acidoferrales bacterium]